MISPEDVGDSVLVDKVFQDSPNSPEFYQVFPAQRYLQARRELQLMPRHNIPHSLVWVLLTSHLQGSKENEVCFIPCL